MPQGAAKVGGCGRGSASQSSWQICISPGSEAHRSSSSVGKVCYVFVDRSRQTGVGTLRVHTYLADPQARPFAKSMNTVIRFEMNALRSGSTSINNIKDRLVREKVADCSSVWISPLLSTTSNGPMSRGPFTSPASASRFKTYCWSGSHKCDTSFDTSKCEDMSILNGVYDRAAQARQFHGRQ